MNPTYTLDMFSGHAASWTHRLGHLAGLPLTYVEVGSYEGASLCWMLSSVLSHPDSVAIAIDTWGPQADWPEWDDKWPAIEAQWLANVAATGRADRTVQVKADSAYGLASIKRPVDIAYIDGSHRAADCLADMLLAWKLTKPGGLLIVDDVAGWSPDPSWQRWDCPQTACDAFATVTGQKPELLLPGQLIWTKR